MPTKPDRYLSALDIKIALVRSESLSEFDYDKARSKAAELLGLLEAREIYLQIQRDATPPGY